MITMSKRNQSLIKKNNKKTSYTPELVPLN